MIVPIDVAFEWVPEVGAPSFKMVAAEWSATIYYYSEDDQYVALKFISCPAYKNEGLNDEDEIRFRQWPEDYARHPAPQFMYTIEESDWQESLGLPSADYRHFILFFKENVFQCLAKGYIFGIEGEVLPQS